MMLLVACKADRDANPVINTGNAPASFVLNVPVQSEQNIDLEKNSIYLTWSNPDYGYNAIATYKVQVGLVQAVGSIKWNTRKIKGEDGHFIDTGEPDYIVSTFNTCKAEISGKNIAMDINQIDGLEKLDEWESGGFEALNQNYRKVAVRVRASINITSSKEVEGTEVYSNPVIFQEMRSYKIIKLPAKLYVVGNYNANGWLDPIEKNEEAYKDCFINETEIGSNVFQGVINVTLKNPQFRFYKGLTGWDGGDSWGPQEKDEGIEVGFDDDGNFPNEDFSDGAIMEGKGSWIFKDFDGGNIEMTVDLNAKTVKFKVEEDEE
jgi:hypothetical protein